MEAIGDVNSVISRCPNFRRTHPLEGNLPLARRRLSAVLEAARRGHGVSRWRRPRLHAACDRVAGLISGRTAHVELRRDLLAAAKLEGHRHLSPIASVRAGFISMT